MGEQTRQEFIRAAITFLRNPKLADCSLQDKLKFLKDKGLSQIEVDEALNLALAHRCNNDSGKWNFLLLMGLCIGGFKLYEAYLLRPKPTSEPNFSEILDKIGELKKLIELQRREFSENTKSLKTLLLGHERFAAPPQIPEWQLNSE